jgi:hypothetical protein
MLMETLPFAFDLRSAHNDAVERHEVLGAPHVHARNVSHRGLLMPLAWLIVETIDSELPVFARQSVPRGVARHLRRCSMQTNPLHEFVTFIVSIAIILYLWVQ